MCIGKNFSRTTKVFSDTVIPGTWPRPRIGIRGKCSCTLAVSNSSYHCVPSCLRYSDAQYTSPNTSISRSKSWLPLVHEVHESTCSSPTTTCTFSDLEKFQNTCMYEMFPISLSPNYRQSCMSYPRNTHALSEECGYLYPTNYRMYFGQLRGYIPRLIRPIHPRRPPTPGHNDRQITPYYPGNRHVWSCSYMKYLVFFLFFVFG